nr:hypothetical protein [Pantoea cypripedii]
MAKKEKVEIIVHTPFIFPSSDGKVTDFARGRHVVDKDVAQHWFVVAHSDQTGTATTNGGDEELQAQIDNLTTQLEEKDKTISDQAEQIEAKDKALSVLTDQLEALKAGAGADGKK